MNTACHRFISLGLEAACVVGMTTPLATSVNLLRAFVVCIESKALVTIQAFHYQHSFEWDDLMIGGEYRKVYCTGQIPVIARSKTWACGRSLAGIASSNPARARMSDSCDCCVVSGRGFCVGLITRPEKSYRVCVCVCVCVSDCDREASVMGRPCPTGVYCAISNKYWR